MKLNSQSLPTGKKGYSIQAFYVLRTVKLF